MGTRTLRGALAATAIALFGAASASVCSANEYSTPSDNQPVQTVTIGQGGYMRLPDLRPAQQVYSLTGTNEYRRTLRAWQAQAGPMYQFGNGQVILPPTR